MGGHPWLRQQEFEAGRYNPVQRYMPEFPSTSDSPAMGAQHASIASAMNASGSEGTCFAGYSYD
jgi:hypothetical protein